jgi:FkbM family methyltransferase
MLSRWVRVFDGPAALLRAIHLWYIGNQVQGATGLPAVPVRLRQSRLPLFCRPGTSDFTTLREIYVWNEYSAAREFIKGPIRTVIDCGSNVGFSIVYFNHLWPDARIVGVEPDPENFEISRQTLAPLVDSGHVKLFRCFVGGSARTATFDFSNGGSDCIRLKDIAGTEPAAGPAVQTAQVMTLSQLMSDNAMERIDVLKLDVEGSEKELFESGGDWVGRTRYIVVELHDDLTADWACQCLSAHGVRCKVLLWAPKFLGMSLLWLELESAGASVQDGPAIDQPAAPDVNLTDSHVALSL